MVNNNEETTLLLNEEENPGLCAKLYNLIKVKDDLKHSYAEESSVSVPHDAGFWTKLWAFVGPALFISVGYLDPGNFATDVQGGSQFGYSLLWVLLLSNVIAMTLQLITAKVALVTRKDLAALCRDEYPRFVNLTLWVFAELAIIATDLAEVLGTAIGLQILFNIPLLIGVLVTALDTFIFLLVQKFGIRKLELFVLFLLGSIGICFVIEFFMIFPSFTDVMLGFVPTVNEQSVYAAIGILGATVMPHNFYLHSALIQTRDYHHSEKGLQQAFKYNIIDTSIALNFAFVVNASILIISGAAFFTRGIIVNELQDADQLLGNLLGSKLASITFGVSLLCSGQSSTLTGTMAGQIVMEGFLSLRIVPWARRLITRLMAIVPAVVVIVVMGPGQTYQLLILSQVILSFALPVAIVPLTQFSASKTIMGPFTNHIVVTVFTTFIVLFIIALNVWAVVGMIQSMAADGWRGIVAAAFLFGPASVILAVVLLWVVFRWKPKPRVGRFYLSLNDSEDVEKFYIQK
eukprot:TRINITY_DN12558_c0_g1_i1.p1 TRINITY_DN12558_c0_g1~~TRINITY_DN12558_c0_g1_i1.p1  ORF type:complete len:518 (-),score=75.07 TRINITY_DN12558_c0_g1_i1:55-1608(-)